MRVYIAGRVSGLPYETVQAKFKAAENLLRASNFNPVSPLDHVNCKASRREAMKKLMPIMLDCDAVLLLDDWQWSEGAQIEAQMAKYADIKMIFEEDLI
jgi:hypothetical protein